MSKLLPYCQRTAILTIGLLLIFTACSDNSTGPDGNDLGEISLTVTGAVDAQRTGQADFDDLGTGSVHSWEISAHDINPQTFSLTFNHIAHEEIGRPDTGTYEIGIGQGPAPWEDPRPMSFYAEYVHIVDEDFTNPSIFSTGFCEEEYPSGGTLTINTSSSDQIVGSFQFTAHDLDFDDSGNCVNNGTINVTGDFTATPRIGL